MIGEIEKKLCDYADALKKAEETEKLEAVRTCLNLCHMVYRAYYANREAHTETNDDILRELALSLPKIKVFKDPNDNKIVYELEDFTFESPYEVISYALKTRTPKGPRHGEKETK